MTQGVAMLQAPTLPHDTVAGGVEFALCQPEQPEVEPSSDDSFERMVRIYQDGEMLLDLFRRTNARLVQARAYLNSDGCNTALGRALVDRLRGRKSWLLARLRANRIAANAVLGLPNSQESLQP